MTGMIKYRLPEPGASLAAWEYAEEKLSGRMKELGAEIESLRIERWGAMGRKKKELAGYLQEALHEREHITPLLQRARDYLAGYYV